MGHLNSHRWLIMSLSMFILCVSLGWTQELNERDAIAPGTKEVRLRYQLLIGGRFTPKGMRVLTVDPNGPGAHMSRLMRGQRVRGILERGDLITKVNGVVVTNPDTYFKALNKSGAGNAAAIVTVRDVNSGQDIDWQVKAVKVQIIAPPENIRPLRKAAKAIKALIVADTDDPTIGEMIAVSVASLPDRLQDVPRLKKDDIRILTSRDVSPAKILREIAALRVDADESLLYYHIGHGAYDRRRAQGDPSSGHFFAIGNGRGDLMRKTVRDRLLAKNAQLTVLISDTCNVSSFANPPRLPQMMTKAYGENWILAHLLTMHTGVIDISGSSTGQYGWFSRDIGGWFTKSFIDASDLDQFKDTRFVTWDAFTKSVSDKTSDLFMTRKRLILGNPDIGREETRNQLRSQEDQRPQIFINRVQPIR